VGLPDTPLRILNPAPPPASVRWLDYKELWLISLPIYLVVMLVALSIAARGRSSDTRHPLTAAALLPVVLLTAAFTIDPADRGVSGSFRASGDVEIEGEGTGTGQITISATDMGNRVTPLPPHDRLSIDASVEGPTHSYALAVQIPLVEDPLGRESTWWGVAFGVDYREPNGDNVTADLVAYGLGALTVDGQVVAEGLPVEVVASRDAEYALSLEVGDDVMPIPGDVPVFTATWGAYEGAAPDGTALAHYIGVSVVLLALLVLGLAVTRRTATRR